MSGSSIVVINKSILWIDLAGVALVLLIGLSLFSYASRPFRQGERMAELRAAIASMEKDAAGINVRVEEGRAGLAASRAQLTEAGKLPEVAPVVEFQTRLAEMAEANAVRITSFAPLADREYPGLVERRFTFDARGETLNLLRFLRAIEADPSWADVGYLSLGRTTTPGESLSERSLGFVICLFASPKPAAPPGTGA